jgi:hypothetical protein
MYFDQKGGAATLAHWKMLADQRRKRDRKFGEELQRNALGYDVKVSAFAKMRATTANTDESEIATQVETVIADAKALSDDNDGLRSSAARRRARLAPDLAASVFFRIGRCAPCAPCRAPWDVCGHKSNRICRITL